MADVEKSKCHNSTVSEKDGKKVCDVCANECEVIAESDGEGGGAATGGEGGEQAVAAKAGDVCTLEGGAEGVLEERDGALVCVEKSQG